MVINDYNISSYGDSSSFYISDVNSVLSNVVNHKNDIILMLDSIDSRHVLNLNTSNDANINSVHVYENGMLMTVSNTIPCDANRYDDFSEANLYLFDNGEVHYILSRDDNRFNRESIVDSDAITQLNSRLGEEIDLVNADNKNNAKDKIDLLISMVNEYLLEDKKDIGKVNN